jgi:hypothetical protein
MYLKNMFSMIGDPKIKVRVFVGPQIKELIQGRKFEDQLSEMEEAAWESLKTVTITFLGNHKAENYRDMMADVVQSY